MARLVAVARGPQFAGGSSTLLMTWIVPLLARMSVLTTFVEPLRKTEPPRTRMLIAGPASVFADWSFTTRGGGDVALDDVVEQHAPERLPVARRASERRLRDRS